MWNARRDKLPDWSEAQRHLQAACPHMRRIIREHGPCKLVPRRNYFVLLCRSIIAQQISTAAATTIYSRFAALFPRKTPKPDLLLKMTDAALRAAGLSRQKVIYVRDLAQHLIDGRLPTRRFATMTDDQIIDALTAVKGIGRWSAEMFLIFTLNRPDVFPVGDLGIQKKLHQLYSPRRKRGPKALILLGERFRPWRTVASWYLWRTIDA
jgi:DNA-3-methyladenine glycosylase II